MSRSPGAQGPQFLKSAFFRNVNLGQPRNLNRAQPEQAFTAGRAVVAKTFLSNRTVIFTAGSQAKARDITAKVGVHIILRLVEKHA